MGNPLASSKCAGCEFTVQHALRWAVSVGGMAQMMALNAVQAKVSIQSEACMSPLCHSGSPCFREDTKHRLLIE